MKKSNAPITYAQGSVSTSMIYGDYAPIDGGVFTDPSGATPLEGLANAHAERVTVPALRQIGAKIDVVHLAQFEPQPRTNVR